MSGEGNYDKMIFLKITVNYHELSCSSSDISEVWKINVTRRFQNFSQIRLNQKSKTWRQLWKSWTKTLAEIVLEGKGGKHFPVTGEIGCFCCKYLDALQERKCVEWMLICGHAIYSRVSSFSFSLLRITTHQILTSAF